MSKTYPNIHQRLIDASARGDRRAQFDIYRLYAKAMYNVVLRIIGNTAEAEDVLQDAFLKVFSKIKTYKGEVSFGAWVKKVVVNSALDHLKVKKLAFDELEEGRVEYVEDETLPDVDAGEQVKLIKQSMAGLPDGYRVILSLVLFEGYDHEEVGQILNISASTSRSQFTRAKRKLLDLINQTKWPT